MWGRPGSWRGTCPSVWSCFLFLGETALCFLKKKKKSEPVHRDRCEEGKRAWPSFATDFDIYSQGLLSFRSLVLFMLHVLDFVLFLKS